MADEQNTTKAKTMQETPEQKSERQRLRRNALQKARNALVTPEQRRRAQDRQNDTRRLQGRRKPLRTPEERIRDTEYMRRWKLAHPSTAASRAKEREQRKAYQTTLTAEEITKRRERQRLRHSTPEAKARHKELYRLRKARRSATDKERDRLKERARYANLTEQQRQRRNRYAREYQKRHGKKRSHEGRLHDGLRRLGITVAEYQTLLSTQDGRCGICGTTKTWPGKRLAVDHCHVTGHIRGLLCRKCNSAIGMLHDDADLVARALAWLTKTPAISKDAV